jgi:light-regulated signal transduction histidine kinase (bacteriophytochrome)
VNSSAEQQEAGWKTAPDDASRLIAQLERRLEERTAELRTLRTEKDTFAHTIAHDLRGPLMHIGGFADLLLEHAGAKLDEKGRHYLRTIITSADQLGRMLSDILALSRLSRAEIHPMPIDLEMLVRKIVQEFESSRANRRVNWQIGNLPEVQADPTLLRQAITHLVTNAFKFTQNRDVARIQIGAERGVHGTTFSVRDNGVGFDMRHSERLFGVFQRLHPSSVFAGNGMGLAWVRRIIERHGGRTWAEGVPDEGAIFYFSLPDGGSEFHEANLSG